MQKSQEEIAKAFIMTRNLMEFLDDGYHNAEIGNLTHISNGLLERMTPANQEKARKWTEKKIRERYGEA